MSDARPITFVTEFVCGSCWNSFSRKAGKIDDAGDTIACPHCGHANPLDVDEAPDVTATVAAAPSASLDINEDSQSFPSATGLPRVPNSFHVRAQGAVVAPTAVPAPVASPRTIDHQATVGYVDAPAGFVVGDGEEFDVGVREDTQVPGGAPPMEAGAAAPSAVPAAVLVQAAQADAASAATTAPAATAPAPTAPQIGEDSLEDLFAAAQTDGQITQDEIDALQVAPTSAPESKAPADQDEDSSISAFADTMESSAVAPAPGFELPAGEPEAVVEPEEWKLKAPTGLTYNFHSLDAMMGWAATKSGSEMNVSADGETWFDFGVFAERVRSGLSGGEALTKLGGAADASSEELRFVGQESGAIQVRSAMDDIAAVDAREAVERRLKLSQSGYDGEGGVTLVASEPSAPSTAADDLNIEALTPEPAPTELSTSSRPSSASLVVPPTTAGRRRASRIQGTEVAGGKGKGSKNNKTTKLQQAPQKQAGSDGISKTMVIAAAVIAVGVIAVIALHFGEIVAIPGLP